MPIQDWSKCSIPFLDSTSTDEPQPRKRPFSVCGKDFTFADETTKPTDYDATNILKGIVLVTCNNRISQWIVITAVSKNSELL